MKRFNRRSILMILSLMGVLVIIAFYITWQTRSQAQPWMNPTYSTVQPTPTRPAWCKPLPYQTILEGTATPTPNLLAQMVSVKKTDQPTYTPYPFTHVFDLAPDLPIEDKGSALVFRCNGEIDEYLIGQMSYAELLNKINLGEGDILSLSSPPSIMGKQPPRITPSRAITQTLQFTPTTVPYP